MASVIVGAENIEPRIKLTFRPFNRIALKAAFGAYNQELVTISNENQIYNIFEPWIITPEYLAVSRATHYMAGLELELLDNFNIDVEGYYKYIKNLPLINERKFFPDDKDLVAGKSKAYGLEALLKYFNNPIRFSLAYTYGSVKNNLYGVEYHPRYDYRHNITISLDVNIGKGWRISSSWFYHSGAPFTKIKGYYYKYHPVIFNSKELNSSYDLLPIHSDKNAGRLPDYHRMDFSISKKFTIKKLKFILDASLINVYNRKNLFYFKPDTKKRVNMLPFLPTATLRVEL